MTSLIEVHQTPAGHDFMNRCRRRPPFFVCTIASTATALIPGVSAAGAGPDLIPYTAAADVEALHHGRAFCLEKIPENPVGPPSPVIITMAALRLLAAPLMVVDAGNAITPQVPMLTAGRIPGRSLTEAVAVDEVERLFLQGILIGEQLGALGHNLILGESVPGGTTTAMALMEALGIAACGRISGSMPGNNQSLKKDLVEKVMRAKGIGHGGCRSEPFKAVRLFGDPMQPVQAGIALSASRHTRVILGGGTQMIAVAALLGTLLENREAAGASIAALFPGREAVFFQPCPDNLAIATTAWVSEDRAADLRGLMRQLPLQIPLFAANLNFSTSRHQNLRLYEEGYVKEGVGAGAMALVAMGYRDLEPSDFLPAIERVYEEIYLQ